MLGNIISGLIFDREVNHPFQFVKRYGPNFKFFLWNCSILQQGGRVPSPDTRFFAKKEKNIRQFSVSQVDLAEDFSWVSAPVSDGVVSADLLLRLLEDGFGVLADLLA